MGFNETLDLLLSKIINKKTLGIYETFSSSYLGVSSCSKPEVKATKYLKSYFKTSSKSSSCAYSYSHAPFRNRSLIPTMLANGEQLHVCSDTTVLVLIVILLFYLSKIKLLHRSFDKGKENILMSSC